MNKNWMLNYNMALYHFNETGSLNGIPGTSKLGRWLGEQRQLYSLGQLDSEKIEMLNKFNMNWLTVRETEWMCYYTFVKKYYDKFGNINIPFFYDYFGLGLGKWVNRQRVAYRAKVANNQTEMKKYKITDKEISLLDELGMVWEASEINKFNSTPELIGR